MLGIEGRSELIGKYAAFPPSPFKDKVTFTCGDFIAEMDNLINQGETFDVIACLGVYYHTIQHYRMLLQMAALKSKLIILDGLFSRANQPLIAVVREATNKKLNTIAQMDNQAIAPIGHVSIPALRIMTETAGYSMTPIPWEVPPDQRRPVNDYFSKFENRVRMTVALRRS